MKRLLPLCWILAIGTTASAQQVQLLRKVVASTGATALINNIIYQYTIGDIAVIPLQNSAVLVTQGFQQPEVSGNGPTPEVILVTDFILYPNPAIGQTRLEFDLLMDSRVNIQLVNNAGQTLRNVGLNMYAGKISYSLPLNGFGSGLYYVVVNAGNKNYTEKLVIQ